MQPRIAASKSAPLPTACKDSDLEAQCFDLSSSEIAKGSAARPRCIIVWLQVAMWLFAVGFGRSLEYLGAPSLMFWHRHPVQPSGPVMVATKAHTPCLPRQSCWPLEEIGRLRTELSSEARLLDGSHAAVVEAFRERCVPEQGSFANFTPSVPKEICDDIRNTYSEVADFWAVSLNLNPIKYKLPGLIVQAASSDDVRRSLDFAQTHNIEVSVHNTGHGYNGQGLTEGGLMIDVSKMGWAKADADAQTITFGGGARWGSVYKEASASGFIVTGGADASVGVVGCIAGACHGEFSRKYGFGADNVVSFTAVVPGGPGKSGARILTASAEAHAELFWAMRGGGPGFAVVTEMTMKMHPAPKANGASGAIYSYKGEICTEECSAFAKDSLSPEYRGCLQRSMERFVLNNTWWQGLGPDWSGYTWNCFAFLIYVGDHLEESLAQEELQSLRPTLVTSWPSQYAMHTEMPQIGLEYAPWRAILNVVPSKEDVERKGTAKAITDAMNRPGETLLAMVTHGAVANELGDDNAVGEGLRRAAGFELVISNPVAHGRKSFDPANLEMLDEAASSLYPLFPSSYVNEWTSVAGHDDVVDWQRRFWGDETYKKLLVVKRLYDPCNMLGVEKSVGFGEVLADGC